MAVMADPFRSPLEFSAGVAALHTEKTFCEAGPVGFAEAVLFGGGCRQATGKYAHRVASEPTIRLLTGVTMGPEIIIDVAAFATWLQDSPRIWRTASMMRLAPCM